jgi:tape measure domain-containing protein
MADIKINIQVVEGQAKAALNGLSKSAEDANKSVNNLNLSFKSTSVAAIAVGNVIANLATKAIGVFTDAVSSLVTGGLELEAQIQNLTNKFQALLPATKDAKQFLEEIAALSDETPFEFEELAEAANKLLVFGVEASKVQSTLKVLGDIATASGANIGELSTAFGKATEAGIITTRELQLFRNNGIPVLQELSSQLGVSTEQVKKLAGEGKISVSAFEQALIGLGEQGSFAFNAMAKAANTLDGSQKKLNDSVESLQRVFGSGLAPAVIVLRNAFATIITSIAEFLNKTNAIATVAEIVVFSFNTIVQTGAALYQTINLTRFAIAELGAGLAYIVTGPIRAVLVGIGHLIEGLIQAAGVLGLNTTALSEAQVAIEGFEKSVASVPITMQETATSIGKDIADTADSVDNFTNGVTNSFGNLVAGMQTAAQGIAETAKTTNQGLTQAQIEEQQKRLEAEIKHNDALIAEQQRKDQALLEQVLIADGELSIQDELQLLRQLDVQTREREQQQIANANKLEDKKAAALLSEKIEADRASRELAIRKKEIDIKKQTEQQELRDREAFFSAATSLANSENKTLLTIGKAAAIAQIAIKTPPAVASSFEFGTKLGGPPLGFAFGAIAATAMAAQAAQIAGVKFADGGIVPGNSFSGDTVSARLNSGEMVLNKQQQANLFDMANNGGSNGGSQVIQINNVIELDGEVVGRSVSRQVANGLKLGEVV